MSGAASDETTIEIDREFTQIIWIVFGKRVQKTFLLMPDGTLHLFESAYHYFQQNTPSSGAKTVLMSSELLLPLGVV